MKQVRALAGMTWTSGVCLALWLPLAAAAPVDAGEADVIGVVAKCSDESVCSFAVTLKHDDKGWEHYADRWEVLAPDGEVLATRTLRHPHVDEQPFTRALHDVLLPAGLEAVRIRAHDRVHEYGGAEHELHLPPEPRPEKTPAP